jgi:glycosyltransferase involved in cell wall biosynthesis
MKVAVVTPTIGSKFLKQCIESVENQTYQNLSHYIFIDGSEYNKKVKRILKDSPNIKLIELEENIGKDWYGHRVYAACSFLVNADVICYLDEDNWFEPNHVEELMKKIEAGADWAYSLRKVYDREGNYLCDDNCESLGKWSIWGNNANYLIDTSSYAVKLNTALNVGHSWYGGWGADRQFFANLKEFFPNYECSGKHTMCYRLDGNELTPKLDFFEAGHKLIEQRYQGDYPWHQ